MKGRKPKPTQRKILEGNPGRRPLNAAEPQLPPLTTEPMAVPKELQGDSAATTEWLRLAPMLVMARQVTEAERGLLIALCLAWSQFLQAHDKISVAGMVIASPSGYPMPNPYVPIANKACTICTKLWAELGLTPTSRSRVMTVGEGDDPFAEFDQPPVLRGVGRWRSGDE